MSVTHESFVQWLGKIQAETADQIANVREVGMNAPDTIYVGREMRTTGPYGPEIKGGTWGNPYREVRFGRFGAIRKYVAYIQRMSEQDRLAFLAPIKIALEDGKKLTCWCAPNACHAHVLAAYANRLVLTPEQVALTKWNQMNPHEIALATQAELTDVQGDAVPEIVPAAPVTAPTNAPVTPAFASAS